MCPETLSCTSPAHGGIGNEFLGDRGRRLSVIGIGWWWRLVGLGVDGAAAELLDDLLEFVDVVGDPGGHRRLLFR